MKNFLLSATALACAAFAAPAWAAHDLPPGDEGSPISLAFPVPSAMTLLADTGLQNLSATDGSTTLSVVMRAAVYQFAPGVLDFVYQIANNSSSNTSVEGLTFSDFGTFAIPGVWQTNVGFGPFLNGVEQADSARRLEAAVAGIDFSGSRFTTDLDAGANALLNPGETSAIFLVRVEAPGFRRGTFTAQDGLTINGAGFAPVPEPATWAMMIGGFGLAGLALRRVRRLRPLEA